MICSWWHGLPADSLGGLLPPLPSSYPPLPSHRNINCLLLLIKSSKNNRQEHPQVCVILSRIADVFILFLMARLESSLGEECGHPCAAPSPHPPRALTPTGSLSHNKQIPPVCSAPSTSGHAMWIIRHDNQLSCYHYHKFIRAINITLHQRLLLFCFVGNILFVKKI